MCDAVLHIQFANGLDVRAITFLAAVAGATGATRKPLGPILADPDTRAFFVALMHEVAAVAAASGVSLPADFEQDQLKFADNAPFSFKASLLHDLEHGSRLELERLSGKLAELGKKLNVPTPANERAYTVLKLHRFERS